MDTLSGQAFNVGGGPDNTISLIELLDLIADLRGKRPETLHEAWRPGDQRYYVSDISKFRNATGWSPRVSVSEGVKRLIRWLEGESGMMEHESNRTSYLDREAVRPPSPVAYSAARRDAP
jgi:nucleoside-diphosphate-sugar epimerase